MKSFLRKFSIFGLLMSSALFMGTACQKNNDGDNGGTSHTHTYEEVWSYNATQHFKKATCEHTTEIKDAEEHVLDGNRCTVCDYLNESVGLEYELSSDENGYVVIGLGTCTDSFITIPSTHEGKPITAIGKSAFSNCNTLTRIEIPSGVKSIGESAFANCNRLVEVINKSQHITVTKGGYDNGSVGYSALEVFNAGDTYTNKFTTDNGYLIYNDGEDTLLITYNGNATKLTLPNTVTKIHKYAFYNNDGIVSAEIPNGVKSIGYEAFYDCDKLTRVVIPDSVTNIADYAFYECSNLTSATLGSGVTSIGNASFFLCYKLVEIINNSSHITITNDYIGYYALSIANCNNSYATKLTTDENGFILYDDSVDKIVVNYIGNENTITLPDNATKIHNYAFYNNDTIVSIVIGNTITAIGDKAFYDCSNLASATLGNGVESIGEEAFKYCYKLVEVINKSQNLTLYKGNAWDGYIGFYALSVSNRENSYATKANIDTNGFVTYNDGTDKILVGYIGNKDRITLPVAVTKIHNYAFYNNDSIVSVEIPNGVTDIGYYAFLSCDNLTAVTLGNGVKHIRDEAFSECRNLTTVKLGNGVIDIGAKAFYNCKKVEKVYYTGSVDEWVQIAFTNGFSNPLSNGAGLYINDELTTTATITTATKINAYALSDYYKLTSITLGSSVKSIGYYAFSVSALEKVYYTGSIDEWVQIEFNSTPLSKSVELYIDNQVVTTASITATKINDKAFYSYGKLTSVTLSDSVTDIGESAFSGCPIETATIPTTACRYIPKTNLKTVVLTSGESIADNAFNNCSNLTSVVIPNSVKTIGANAFSGCPIETATIPTMACGYIPKTALKTLVITSGESIADNAFNSCDKLVSVTLGDSVTSIGNMAFYDCSNLASVTLGNGVISIGEEAFCLCSNLATVTIGSGVKSIGNEAFANCYSLVEVINNSSHITVTKGETANGYIGHYALNISNCDSSYTTRVSIDTDGFVIYDDGTDKIVVAFVGSEKNITLPNGTTKIYRKAFWDNTNITGVVIPDSVTDIGYDAFAWCTNLTTVIIGDGVTSIGISAFAYCTNLTTVIIGDGVTNIGSSAFHECRNLVNLTIGSGVTRIGSLSFIINCGTIENITYNGTKAQWNAISKDSAWVGKIAAGEVNYFYITCRDGKIKI